MIKLRRLFLLVSFLLVGLFGAVTVHGQSEHAAAEKVRTALITDYCQTNFQLAPQAITYDYQQLPLGATGQAMVKFAPAAVAYNPFLHDYAPKAVVQLTFYPAAEAKQKPWVNSTRQALANWVNRAFADVISYADATTGYYLRQTDGKGPFQVTNIAFTPTATQSQTFIQHYAQLQAPDARSEPAALQQAVDLGLVGHEFDLFFSAPRWLAYGYRADETDQLIRDNLASELQVKHLTAGTKFNVWTTDDVAYTYVYQNGDFKQLAGDRVTSRSSRKYLNQLIAKKTVYMTTLRATSGGGYGPVPGEVSVLNFFPGQWVTYYDDDHGKYSLHKGSLALGSTDHVTGTTIEHVWRVGPNDYRAWMTTAADDGSGGSFVVKLTGAAKRWD
ncbi:hypothetical protein [Loigolactobacillus binensis]|uniref:Uncharacterized protein n=1 Tax=Loigolactobacillus binensis TaxID=2559922 RepID=A0ABW3E9G5_9LACO|nr:hypothetical protein [Loigolactobacillus binensis]